jgi:predicted RND superfamily exporter protein
MVPNAAPVLVIFGVMGTLDLAIDAGTVLVGSFALGVAVDDTIHIVTAYDSEQARGADGPSALRRGLVRVLPAVVYTTVIVSAGFAVLALSDFAFTRNLGVLTASVMVLCLLADLTLLPALLLRVEESDSARTP